MCTRDISSWVLIDTLDWYPQSIPLIDPQSILDRHSINTLVGTRLTLHRPLGWQSTNFRSIHTSWSTLDRLLIECQPSINSDIDQTVYWSRCRLRVLMESIDQHSTVDAFSTHDPDSEGIKISIDLFSNCTIFVLYLFPSSQ